MSAPQALTVVAEPDPAGISVRPPHLKLSREAEPCYDMRVTLKSEPRIQYLQRLLRSILELGKFTFEGHEYEVDGFVLKDLDHWTRPSEGDPDELFCVLSRPCNARCEFCYVHGNPPDLSVQFNNLSTEVNRKELAIRTRLFTQGRALFSPTYDTEEILINPNFYDTALKIRAASKTRMNIITNGYLLREEMLLKLKDLEPIELSVSLNSVDQSIRKQLMGNTHRVAVSSLERLDKMEFRYTVSMVAWPTVPIEKLEETILYADRFHPYAIHVHLPGYTKFFSRAPLFDRESYWREIVKELRPLRSRLRNCLIITPRLFEENLYFNPVGEAVVVGTTPDSPGALAGLCYGDVIVRIGDVPVITRAQALAALVRLRTRCIDRIELAISRCGEQRVLQLDAGLAASRGYRYAPPYRDIYGIHLIAGSIGIGAIRQLFQVINRQNADRVLLISSPLVTPLAEQMIQDFAPLLGRECDLDVIAAENRYFGGTICIGELLTVDDFVACAREQLARKKYDLVVIPSAAFRVGGWYRDLRGVPFSDIGRRLQVPVEMLVADAFE
jgi:hypothetical protein